MDASRIAGCNAQYVRRTTAEFVEAQARLGIRRIELVAQVPHIWCDHFECESPAAVAALLRGAGIEVAAFTPRLYRYSICAPAGSLQARATDSYFSKTMEIAAALGAPILCVETGGGAFDAPHGTLWENARNALERLFAKAEGFGLRLAVAPSSPEDSPILTSLNEITRMRSELATKKFAAVLDTRVASVAGETIGEWFDALGGDILLVRFVDGNYNGWRVWGDGCLPCGRFLRELESCGYGGVLSQHRKGERDVDDPGGADARNFAYLTERMREIEEAGEAGKRL